MTLTLKDCLNQIGVSNVELVLDTCENLDQEFKILRRAYFSAILIAHPDKGGTAEEFRKIQAAFEVIKSIYEKGEIPTFVWQGEFNSSAVFNEEHEFDASTMPVPSWEFYEAAAAETIPTYRVEKAKSNRSKCGQKGKACHHGPKPDDAYIKQDELRCGSFDSDAGTYARWNHLTCWRVPTKIWKGLPDPDSCQDADIFARCLKNMNEVQNKRF